MTDVRDGEARQTSEAGGQDRRQQLTDKKTSETERQDRRQRLRDKTDVRDGDKIDVRD